jgi:hypothetical protein
MKRYAKRRLALPAWIVLIATTVTLAGCASRPIAVEATPTPAVAQFCTMRVEGRDVKDEAGKVLVMHGAQLPTITEMEASDRKPEQRLKEIAAAGAKVVRILVRENEMTPTFVPAKVSPFIDQANELGMLVILAYDNDTDFSSSSKLNDTSEKAEDWLRLAMTYLLKSPGVMYEPFNAPPVNSPKWSAIAQRMVDVVRGFGADTVMLITEPDWLKNGGALLKGGNVAYAAASLDGYPINDAPFVVEPFDGTDAPAIQAAKVWSLAPEAQAGGLSSLWKSSVSCR